MATMHDYECLICGHTEKVKSREIDENQPTCGACDAVAWRASKVFHGEELVATDYVYDGNIGWGNSHSDENFKPGTGKVPQ